MFIEKQSVASAQVVLRSANGQPIDGAIITAETIKDFAPEPETVTKAAATFAALGFDVQKMVGISFPITATLATFEEVFKTHLCQKEDKANDGVGSYELPLEALPDSVANLVLAVTFMPPPDFGPTQFFGP
jgi:subtilase family serine protease